MTQSKQSRFLGKGWRFPVAPDSQSGGLEYLAGADTVRQSIAVILATEPGERIMRPQFGCGLRQYLMKPNTVATRALIQRDVQQSLESWEPRIRLLAVNVEPDLDDRSLILIDIRYEHARDGRVDNLVFPFYLE